MQNYQITSLKQFNHKYSQNIKINTPNFVFLIDGKPHVICDKPKIKNEQLIFD